MKRVVIAFLILFAAVPLFAQSPNRSLTAWLSHMELENTQFDDDFETDFSEGLGYGISANFFFTNHLSAEVSLFTLRSDAELNLADEVALDLGRAELVPLSLGAQLHLAGQRRIDPYIGGGASYVMGDEFFSADLEAVGLGPIELEDKVTWYANAGVGFQLTQGLGLVLDARYFAYETASRSSVTGVEQDLELTPFVVSGGLRLRF
jgi:outer membrane protein W